MNCPKCNNPLPPTICTFCPNCGAPVSSGVPGTTQVVTPPTGAAPQTIPSHLAMAIFSTLCCCLPLGIVAIVYASQVSSKVAAGDIAGAQAASHSAKVWGILSIVLGVIGSIIGFGVQVLLYMAANQQ
jgi:hypothetical protein